MQGSGASRARRRAARFWSGVLLAYGRHLPYHPRKWQVLEALLPLTDGLDDTGRRIRRDGVSYDVDLRQSMDRFLYYLDYERWETRSLRKIIQPGWQVLDVGANIGYYTLLFARLVGSAGRVYAFEPAENTFSALLRNVALNPFAAAIVHPQRVALAGSQGSGSLVFGAHHGLTRLANAGEAGSEAVHVTTLDRFVEEHAVNAVHFIKIDIEGAEQHFLDGAAATIGRHRPVLMIEVNPAGLASSGSSAAMLLERLRELRYTLHEPTWRGLRELEETPRIKHYLNVIARPR
jgi:FkbM family methyltransferase